MYDSEHGIDMLDGICMMLIAIGESLKHIDKLTENSFLKEYPEVDWQGAKGVRDILSHHYFDLNSEVVFNICNDHMPKMMETVSKMIDDLGSEIEFS